MWLKKTSSALLGIGFLFLGGGFFHTFAAPATLEERIQEIVEQRHPTDTVATWQALGGEAPTTIIAMYQKTTRTYVQLRLLQGLGWFDQSEAVEFLKTQAAENTNSVFRNAAVQAVGVSQGRKEFEWISEFLKYPDPQTRLAAGLALQRIISVDPIGGKGDPVQSQLDAYKKSEKLGWVVKRLENEYPVGQKTDLRFRRFQGKWRGVWLKGASDRDSGLESTGVEGLIADLEWKVDLKGKVTGILKALPLRNSKDKMREFEFVDSRVREDQVLGFFTERNGISKDKKREKINARLKMETSAPVLVIDVEGTHELLYLRR